MAEEPDEPNATPVFYWRGRPSLDSDLTFERVSRYSRRAVITAIDRLTDTGTVRISFQATGDQQFDFWPGQWIGLEEEVPGVGPRRSSYCIFSPPTEDGRFELLIRVLVDGPLSNHLVSLHPGYIVKFRGPLGRPAFPKPTDAELILLATGVGIAPLYSLSRLLLGQGDPRPIRLYWGLRRTEDICLLDELNELADGLPNFSYHISLSEPPADWPHLRGRVTESVPPLLGTLGGKRYFLSGNGAMIEEIELALCSLGVDRTYIWEEKFFNLKHRPGRETMDAILDRFVADDMVSGRPNLLPRVWKVREPDQPG